MSQLPNIENGFQLPPNLMEMAQKIAQSMPTTNSEGEQLDIKDMVSHVTKSVSQMMGTGDMDLTNITQTLVSTFEGMQQQTSGASQSSVPSKVKLPLVDPKQTKESYFEELDDDSDADEFQPRTKDLHFNLNVDLADFYRGKVKKLAIRRKRIQKEGGKLKVIEEKKKIAINVEPGMRDEQIIRFNKEADELPGHETGDIVITLCENPHGYFEREGDNLFIVKKISLYEALAVTCDREIELNIEHLDGTYLKIKTDKKTLHANEGIWKIRGEGMPLYKKEGKGDLYIRFNLIIPDSIDKKQIDLVKELFPPYNSNFGLENKRVRECDLEEVTEEDMEALDYNYSDYEDDYTTESESTESYQSKNGRTKQTRRRE